MLLSVYLSILCVVHTRYHFHVISYSQLSFPTIDWILLLRTKLAGHYIYNCYIRRK